jgi:NADH:ubiquinone reductase (H+-translocating)
MEALMTEGHGTAPAVRHRVVIAGGGFGGLYAALELEKTLARDADVEITLINKDNFFLFTPMLHEVAASDIDLTHIVSPVRALLRRIRFFQGEVVGIDTAARTIQVTHGFESDRHALGYDYLIVALGSVTNFHGLPGLARHAVTMKTLGDAIHLRNRVIAHLEEADVEEERERRSRLLTVVVAGGGFAGIETAASLYDFVLESLPFYRNVSAADVRMIVVHSGNIVLPELGPELGAYAQQKLSERGIQIITGTRVAGVSEQGVMLASGLLIPTTLIIWTAGTSPNPLLKDVTSALSAGRLMVNEYLEVKGVDRVWALGDCAAVPNARTGALQPPTAQHALREGRVAARNVRAAIRGGRRVPFEFGGLGQLAAIGKRTGVARIFGVRFSGFPAWWLWRTVYLLKLPRFEKKLRVALDWTLDLFFSKDIVQFLTVREAGMAGRAEDAITPEHLAVGSAGGGGHAETA